MGNYDYNEKYEPNISMKDKTGRRIDKNMRTVNAHGWLNDKDGNIIDNKGQIKFIKE